MTKSEIFTQYNKARAVARRNGVLDEARVNRALGILQTKDYELEYLTDTRSCSCPDHQYRGMNCKHIICAMIKARIGHLQ